MCLHHTTAFCMMRFAITCLDKDMLSYTGMYKMLILSCNLGKLRPLQQAFDGVTSEPFAQL